MNLAGVARVSRLRNPFWSDGMTIAPVRRPARTRRLLAALCILGLAGCSATAEPGPRSGREVTMRRAALATIRIENQTHERLRIAFRPTSPGGRLVFVGSVGPRETGSVAPILAGEPVTLFALTPDGRELRLPPRSFAADERWTWVIPYGDL